MKMKFQVIRDGDTIFESTADDKSGFPKLTKKALKKFGKEHPTISLLDEDVILKWSEVSTD